MWFVFWPEAGFSAQGGVKMKQFNQAKVEEFALFYAVESVRKLRIPLVLRIMSIGHDNPTREERIEDIKANPPKADNRGNVYPFGSGNSMSFVLEPETGALLVHERMMKGRGKMPLWGLTMREHAQALNAATTLKERGGFNFVYDSFRDSLALQRRYDHPPKDKKQFFKEMNHLKKIGLKWFDGRFLEKTNEIIAQRTPPTTAVQTDSGFKARLLLRHFGVPPEESQRSLERFVNAWDRPDGNRAPRLLTDKDLSFGQKMYAFILFEGATHGEDGTSQVSAFFRLVGPRERLLLENKSPIVWSIPARSEDHIQLGFNDISFRIQNEPAGTYRVEAEVCDVATNRRVKLVHPFVLH